MKNILRYIDKTIKDGFVFMRGMDYFDTNRALQLSAAGYKNKLLYGAVVDSMKLADKKGNPINNTRKELILNKNMSTLSDISLRSLAFENDVGDNMITLYDSTDYGSGKMIGVFAFTKPSYNDYEYRGGKELHGKPWIHIKLPQSVRGVRGLVIMRF